MKTAAILGVAFLSCVAVGAGAAPQTKQAGGSGDPAIKAVADNYVKASLAGDAKAIAALYTEDAVEMPPNRELIKGRDAIEKYYTGLMGGGKLSSFTLTHLESRGSGDSGYDIGTYQQSMTPPGATAPVTETGKYAVILRKVGGAWKVAYAIYNSDRAAAR